MTTGAFTPLLVELGEPEGVVDGAPEAGNPGTVFEGL